jgi:hypothetical protein
MKTKFKLIVLVISFLFCGITYGQEEFLSVTSSQILKGLSNKDYLKGILMQDGFTMIKNWKIRNIKSGIYEYWQFKSEIFFDLIYNSSSESYIIVRVYKDVKDFPERLIATFPHKSMGERDDYLTDIKVNHINKKTPYTLYYSQDGKNLGVNIWYDDPYYYFQYSAVR